MIDLKVVSFPRLVKAVRVISGPGSAARVEELELTSEAMALLSTSEDKLRSAFGGESLAESHRAAA